MTANNFSLEISKYPQFRTPISDVGLEPKERAIFQSSLPAISELVDHQHLVAVAGDATKIKREERAFYVGLRARLNRGERATRRCSTRRSDSEACDPSSFLPRKGPVAELVPGSTIQSTGKEIRDFTLLAAMASPIKSVSSSGAGQIRS